jgi:hypothetical protein
MASIGGSERAVGGAGDPDGFEYTRGAPIVSGGGTSEGGAAGIDSWLTLSSTVRMGSNFAMMARETIVPRVTQRIVDPGPWIAR